MDLGTLGRMDDMNDLEAAFAKALKGIGNNPPMEA
jgi:hypothetical protein